MIVGLTGHQIIGNEKTEQWVQKQMYALLVSERVTEGWMSLAVGADQMFASLLLREGLPYRVVIPCKRYVDTFTVDDRDKYNYLLSNASSVIHLDYLEPSEAAFYAAGKEVVRKSETMIAVWDGLGAKGLGGTADIVHFAQSLSKRVLHINVSARAVNEI
jgi:hypothetical protein